MTNLEIQELRKLLIEKRKENEKLQSGISTSTICTEYSNMFIVTSTVDGKLIIIVQMYKLRKTFLSFH